MKACVTVVATVAVALLSGEAAAADDDPLPPSVGPALLARSVSNLPREPLGILGSITIRRQRGIVLKQYRFEMRLDFAAEPPNADYLIMDDEGARLRRLRVERGDRPVLRFETPGGELIADPPPLTGRVEGTDLTWLDLTLDFLWWPEARVEREDRLKGRTCDVVLAKPPEPIAGCIAARLWLDRELGFLLQAEQLDAQGKPSRRMWVRSVKKIEDRWIIRDLEVETIRSGHRTRLHVDDVFSPP